MKPKVGDIISIKIDRLTYNGGRGLGRHLNFVVFVPNTAPGDFAKVQITEVKKNYSTAKLITIIEPGEQRISPPCLFSIDCGGCQWQHISYNEQVRQKKSFIERCLSNLKVKIATEVTPSPRQLHYRNRIQLHNQGNKIGYHKNKSHQLIAINKCLIADDRINFELTKVKPSNKKERIEIAVTKSGKVISHNPKASYAHNLFSQVNTEVNGILVNHVLKQANKEKYSHIYDAYCGQGNFAFPILENFKNTPITGIELSRENIKSAKEKNTKINFIELSVEKFFEQNPAPENSLIILDPPRVGCHKSLFKNIKFAKTVIYISCDLSTFERDAKLLLENNFSLNKMDGFDMFPQTSHIEVCGVFSK